MLRRTSIALAVAAVTALPAFGCHREPAKGPVVAEGRGLVITAGDLKARIDEQPPMVRQSFQSLDRKKAFLDNLLRFELLAKAAEKEGLAKDPEVEFAMKKVLVSRYYQRFFQDKDAAAKTVSDAEVQSYFDGHKEEFHRPARVHALHLFLAAEASSPDRAKKAAEAKKLLANPGPGGEEPQRVLRLGARALRGPADEAAGRGPGDADPRGSSRPHRARSPSPRPSPTWATDRPRRA